MVVGPTGSGKRRLVEAVLDTYYVDKFKGGGLAVAHVKGLVCTTDQQALCTIADQFLLRSGTGFEKNVSVVLQDLEAHFRQCMIDGCPAVVVLEDIHIFAAREKQVLIYTLLDFMHKQDLLFVVVGITPCAHLNSLLEKRVLSRLNAQFVYVPPVSGEDVLKELRRRLRLPEQPPASDADADHENGGADDGHAEAETDADRDEYLAYCKRFNAAASSALTDRSAAAEASAVSVYASGAGIANWNANGNGGLSFAIRRYAEWGKGVSHFLRAAHLAVALLSPSEPVLTATGLESALFSQDPPCLAERLAQLPPLELRLFAALARLHGKKMGSGAVAATAASATTVADMGSIGTGTDCTVTGGGGAGGVGKKATGAKAAKDRSISVEEILRELELMTAALRTKETTTARLMLGLQALASQGLLLLTNAAGVASAAAAAHRPVPSRLLSERSLVVMLPPEYEVREAFGARPEFEGLAARSRGVGRSVPTLVLSERVRGAVLEPLKPLVM